MLYAMFIHTALRPLWPVIGLIPWVTVGVWYLLQAVRQKVQTSSRTRGLHVSALFGVALLAAARIVSADTPVEPSRSCEAATVDEAHSLADRLYASEDYQRAGQCYQAAGDLTRANLAFLKAAGPASEDTARKLKVQRDVARALFTSVAQSFESKH